MNNVIEVNSLTKSYGGKKALEDFSLEVPQNSIFGLLGPNGAGKTTAIEIMLGLRKEDSGSSLILGTDPQKDFLKIASRIGAMLQQGGINPGLKPKEAVELFAALYPNSLDVDELLDKVDLKDVQTLVRRLSGGQAQSLSLAVAIVGKPELVFLDEPTVGMDPLARRRTWEIIKGLKSQGSTVVLTTHHMDEAELLCDDIAIVSAGRVIAQGDLQTLTHSNKGQIDVEFAEKIDSETLSSQLSCEAFNISDNSVRLEVETTSDFLVTLAQYAKKHENLILSFTSQAKNLEDVFIELTEQDKEMVTQN